MWPSLSLVLCLQAVLALASAARAHEITSCGSIFGLRCAPMCGIHSMALCCATVFALPSAAYAHKSSSYGLSFVLHSYAWPFLKFTIELSRKELMR